MSRRIRTYGVTLDRQTAIYAAPGEDCTYRVAFLNPDGTPYDFTDMLVVTMAWRDPRGVEFLSRGGDVVGSPTAGVVDFEVNQTDTDGQIPQVDRWDVWVTDSSQERAQIGVDAPMEMLPTVGHIGDPVTTPPAVPITFGLTWRGLWDMDTQYAVNDAVQYPDVNGGSSDALSSFRAISIPALGLPPQNGIGVLNTGWAYVAERGADGAPGTPSEGYYSGTITSVDDVSEDSAIFYQVPLNRSAKVRIEAAVYRDDNKASGFDITGTVYDNGTGQIAIASGDFQAIVPPDNFVNFPTWIFGVDIQVPGRGLFCTFQGSIGGSYKVKFTAKVTESQ